MKFPGKTICFAALFAVVLASTVPAAAADHYLIADQFNNRVIEVDHRGNVVWHFGLGPSDFSAASVIGVNDDPKAASASARILYIAETTEE
jgi:hypothetical protein